MHMLTYTAKESPVGITTDTGDMYLVAAAKDGDHHAYAELCRRHSQPIYRTVYGSRATLQMLKTRYKKRC
jgi:hypothetical protein